MKIDMNSENAEKFMQENGYSNYRLESGLVLFVGETEEDGLQLLLHVSDDANTRLIRQSAWEVLDRKASLDKFQGKTGFLTDKQLIYLIIKDTSTKKSATNKELLKNLKAAGAPISIRKAYRMGRFTYPEVITAVNEKFWELIARSKGKEFAPDKSSPYKPILDFYMAAFSEFHINESEIAKRMIRLFGFGQNTVDHFVADGINVIKEGYQPLLEEPLTRERFTKTLKKYKTT